MPFQARSVYLWGGALLLLSGCATPQTSGGNAFFSASVDRTEPVRVGPYQEALAAPLVEDERVNGMPKNPATIDPSPDMELHSGVPPREQPKRPVKIVALPPDADPAYSTPVGLDVDVDASQATKNIIDDPTGQAAGTVTIDTKQRKLYISMKNGQATEYRVGVGRQGFEWKGAAEVGRKAFWPGWTPPKEMLLRRPDLPKHMDGSLENPLGARALYLFKNGKDTLFRIHGTNEPDTIGQAVSSGCIRMTNADVIDLYSRVSKGTKVVVK
jgi:lipoprotein-anchoring transpeptidase ErfK/SrfK